MKYSFVVIAYNESEGIADCISSIMSLDGIGKSYEIVVVNDASTDKTEEIVSEQAQTRKQIKLISNAQNSGRGYSRNAGIAVTKGEYIAMVDGDIVLPKEWLSKCLEKVDEYDAVGGTAVPDGDVMYVFNRLKLEPKVVPHTTTVTGSNGLYNSAVFRTLKFDKTLRQGEDVDFNHRFSEKLLKSSNIDGLLVEHIEKKSYYESIKWLYESGLGASKQLRHERKVRKPDLVYLGLLVVTILSCLIVVMSQASVLVLLAIPLYILFVSLLHIFSKFYVEPTMKGIIAFTAATIINATLLLSYFVGRTTGGLGVSN